MVLFDLVVRKFGKNVPQPVNVNHEVQQCSPQVGLGKGKVNEKEKQQFLYHSLECQLITT